jgi:hypothetical protein
MFGGSSYVDRLMLSNNNMKNIASAAFHNVSVDYLYLENNELTVFPVAVNNKQNNNKKNIPLQQLILQNEFDCQTHFVLTTYIPYGCIWLTATGKTVSSLFSKYK